MKSKSNELLDKSISAMIAAIEVYNKPDFLYRGETFSILAINSWELLLKAKYLKDNHNKMRSLYVMEPVINKDGNIVENEDGFEQNYRSTGKDVIEKYQKEDFSSIILK